MGFAASDSATGLKLMDAGVPKEKLVILAMPMVPLQIVLPLVISRYTAGPRPMDVFLKAYPYRLLCGLIFAAIVWVTPLMVIDNHIPLYYYGILIIGYSLHQVAVYSMFVAVMAFFAQISDPAVGGTYMTLLNTVCNLGGNWPSTVALWFIDALTYKSCELTNGPLQGNDCSSSTETEACLAAGGKCNTVLDGYYIESFICIAIGFVWLGWARPLIHRLQSYDESVWKVSSSQ